MTKMRYVSLLCFSTRIFTEKKKLHAFVCLVSLASERGYFFYRRISSPMESKSIRTGTFSMNPSNFIANLSSYRSRRHFTEPQPEYPLLQVFFILPFLLSFLWEFLRPNEKLLRCKCTIRKNLMSKL